MKPRPTILTTLLGAATVFLAGRSFAQDLRFEDTFTSTAGGGEIVAYDKSNYTVFGTYSQTTNDVKTLAVTSFGVDYSILQADGQFGPSGWIDIAAYFASNFPGYKVNSLTSVAVDPLGRGFGVAAITPSITNGSTFEDTWAAGKIVLFDTHQKTVIGSYDVGYHPDMVTFSPDGSKIIVANEGEFNATNAFQAPGSLTVVDLSTVGSNYSGATVNTYDFSAPNLGAGVSLTGLRDNTRTMNTPTTAALAINIEPEYAKVTGNTVVVTLQENNALATFDLGTNQWTKISGLGTITQTIDASDRDNPTNNNGIIAIDKPVKTMAMPDGVDSFSIGSNKFYVTANEGDFRFDDGDKKRVSAFAVGDGQVGKLDPALNASLNKTDEGVGRLSVSTVDGDTDGDGDLDEIVLPGSRSFSIWDANGVRLFDSNGLDFGGGKFGLEQYIAAYDPAGFDDARSDDKGPEPEGITLGVIDGDLYAFLGLERTNHVFMFKIKDDIDAATSFDASDVSFVDAIRTPGQVAPEGMTFISAAESPTGQAMLIVGNETSGTWTSYSVPEPSAALFILGGFGAMAFRRRRRA